MRSTNEVEQLLFSIVPSILTLFWGHFWLFGAIIGYFWSPVGFKNIFWVHSCSWTTFIFYSSFNSDFKIWLNFRFIFLLFGVMMGYFLVRVGFKNYFWVYSRSWTTFILYVSVNSDIWFRLNFLVILSFWGPNGLFLGFR